ncbi:carbonic anhydrase [uncultured Sulfitobacter sp.]|uniref:carbonic anhydrase n=1 Tax=uncultured Sulfitobacter sp. TaxID=191468 RepID=UPI00338DFB5E
MRQHGRDVVQLCIKSRLRIVAAQLDATAGGQTPLAVVLSCIDSRVPAELVFDLGIGDVFSIRVAGNVIGSKSLGSIEYGVGVAGVKLVLFPGWDYEELCLLYWRSFLS